ncbi:MAG: hypothetical protein R2684_11985 [Pyrinomonadaceae bacterium]
MNQNEENALEEGHELVPVSRQTNGYDTTWIATSGLILFIAGFLRFFWIELKPLHHDEGVNGHFLTNLFRNGVYHYDPGNYHGPDLYFLSLSFSKVFGLNTTSVRFSVAIFGFLTVVLALYLKRFLGRTGTLATAFFLALSPGMVFISRYFIHEILFVFLSLSIVVAVLMFFYNEKLGIGGIIWMALLMMVCFMPVSVMGTSVLGLTGYYPILAVRLAIVVVECVLIFFVLRMLLDWKSGRPVYLMLAAASFALLYATKETGFITHGTMLIALACVFIWNKFPGSLFKKPKLLYVALAFPALIGVVKIAAVAFYYDDSKTFLKQIYTFFSGSNGPNQIWLLAIIMLMCAVSAISYFLFAFRVTPEFEGFENPVPVADRLRGWGTADKALVGAAVFFVVTYLIVLFFTSFFQYPSDLPNFFRAYAFWAKTGTTDHTQNGRLAYFRWLMEIESPLLVLSAIGFMVSLVLRKHRFVIFTGFWAWGLTAAYTIISYKTPWLALSFTLPMAVCAGYLIGSFLESGDKVLKIAGAVLGILASVILAYQTYDQNFVRHDDEEMPYVYAHTRRGFEDMITEIRKFSDRSTKKKEIVLDVVSQDYWPMPWYVNDFKHANFHGRMIDNSDAEVIVGKSDQATELAEKFGSRYKFIGEYPLRPGVELWLLVRNDLAAGEGKSIYEKMGK